MHSLMFGKNSLNELRSGARWLACFGLTLGFACHDLGNSFDEPIANDGQGGTNPTSGAAGTSAARTDVGHGGATPEGGAYARGGQAGLGQMAAGAGGQASGGAHAGGGGLGGSSPSMACDPTLPFVKVEPVEELNTRYFEAGAWLSSDGLKLYFHSNRSVALATPEEREGNGDLSISFADIYVATRPCVLDTSGKPCTFETVELAKGLSKPAPIGDRNVSMSRDGLTLFFDTYRPYRSIWRATRTDATVDMWGVFEDIEQVKVIASNNEDMYPHIAANGERLYFTSSRPGFAPYGFDIWWAPIVQGVVLEPKLLKNVNSDDGEFASVPSEDERVLYFARRPKTDGARSWTDIWMATRATVDEPFSNPHSIKGSDVNSSLDDVPSYVSPDGCTLYFHSNRGQSDESFDLYRAYRRVP